MKRIVMGTVCLLLCGGMAFGVAEQPVWLVNLGQYGQIDTRPNGDEKCVYHVFGQQIAIEALPAIEVEVEGNFFGWKFKYKQKEQPVWEVYQEMLLPAFPVLPTPEDFSPWELAEETLPGTKPGETVVVPVYRLKMMVDENGDLVPIPTPELPDENAVCSFHQECIEIAENWQHDQLQYYERVSGNGELPAGMRVTVMQRTGMDGRADVFLIDPDTRTIWKSKL